MARADISRVALRQVVSEEKHCVTTLITAAKETNRKSKDYQLRFCVIGTPTTKQTIGRIKCIYTNLQVFPFRGRQKLFYRYAENSYKARQHAPLHPPLTCEGIPTKKSKAFFKYPQFLICNCRLSTCQQCHKHTGIHARPRPLEKSVIILSFFFFFIHSKNLSGTIKCLKF